MKYPLCIAVACLALSGCGGGSTGADAAGIDTLNALAELEFEEYTLRGIAPDVDYVGGAEPLVTLEEIAAGLNFSAVERNEIPMNSQCRYRIYTSQGAILDWFFDGPAIYFTDGGRLSGGFSTGHTIYTINNTFHYDMGVRVPEQDGVDVILFTPEQYGENIVANVTRMALNETITRILQLAPCFD